jgi:hypothetical protein
MIGNTAKKYLTVFFALFLVALLVFLLYWLVKSFAALDKSIIASTIAGLFAVATVLATYVRENSLKRQEAHRDKKIEVYSLFFDFIHEAVVRARNNEGLPEKTLQLQRFDEFNRNLMFYGAPEVIVAFNEWHVASLQSNEDVVRDQLAPIGKILLAMRRDIGLSNKGLSALDIQQIHISDDLKRQLKK